MKEYAISHQRIMRLTGHCHCRVHKKTMNHSTMLFLSCSQMAAISLLANEINPTSTGLPSWARMLKHNIRDVGGLFLVLSQCKDILQIMHYFSWLVFTLAYQIVNFTTCQDGDVFTDRSSNLYFLDSWTLDPLQ